ncbi:hypothetical protein GCM10009430_41380 [Aquimarina litoralis]|uniref:Uncharacterized protein n=1 Tax=Aquimarina litoralis TaxID=584605 RepID=A0ABP3UGJ3_9FLAO
MKNLINTTFIIIVLFFGVTTVKAQETNQEKEIIEGVFDGFDGENFTFKYITEDGDEDIVLFPKAEPEVLEKYNLSDEKFIGKKFNITFKTEWETETDEDGDEQEYELRTIIDLELLD